jgi:ribosome recycling factor
MKTAKDKLEEAKKRVRVVRDDLMKEFQTLEKAGGVGKDDVFRYKADAQKLIDAMNKTLDEAYGRKEKEILS